MIDLSQLTEDQINELQLQIQKHKEEKQFQRMNKEFKEIVKKEENKIILKVLKDIFDKDKNE